jgi:hypothetical protein
MPAKTRQSKKAGKERKFPKARPSAKAGPGAAGKTRHVATTPSLETSGSLAGEVKRLAREVEQLKAAIQKRPAGGVEAPVRRDQDKIVADRLARLDEKIESLWGRVADLEEHFEGEGGRTRDTEYEEPPDRDFFEH